MASRSLPLATSTSESVLPQQQSPVRGHPEKKRDRGRVSDGMLGKSGDCRNQFPRSGPSRRYHPPPGRGRPQKQPHTMRFRHCRRNEPNPAWPARQAPLHSCATTGPARPALLASQSSTVPSLPPLARIRWSVEKASELIRPECLAEDTRRHRSPGPRAGSRPRWQKPAFGHRE